MSTQSFGSLFCLFLLSLQLNAQNRPSLTGRILDGNTQAPIEYASVSLHLSKDSTLLNGMLTDVNGNFEFKKVDKEEYFVQVQFMGYVPFRSKEFEMQESLDLGEIKLSIKSLELSEVEIIGHEDIQFHKLDKQVYRANQFQQAQGGNAKDVLANLPAVSVNALGEISVRGTTGFQVMVNGKPSQSDPALILEQIPANSIEDIEIITAPSAKYDPDGTAGIINIKTKQALLEGFYLMVNALMGLPSIEPYENAEAARRFGGDVNMNYRKGKWDLSAGIDYKRNDISGRREGYVNTYFDEILTEFPSDGERSFDEEAYRGRLTATFTPNKRQAITAGFYAGKRSKDRTADILYLDQRRTRVPENEFLGTEAYWDLYQESGDVFRGGPELSLFTFYNENLRVRRGDFLIGALDYSLQLTDQSSLKFSGLYERTILGGPTDNVSLGWPNTDFIYQLQFNTNDNPLDGLRLQADYTRKLGKADWEMGYQFRFLKHPGDFVYLDRNLDNDSWEENPLFTNGIDLRRTIHSYYNQVAGKKGKWEYILGLRMEYFDRKVMIERPERTFDLDQFNLFPSLNIGYDLGNDWQWKAAYSRRIERTTTFKMTPFPEREHSETLEQGDAELLPEYIDLVETGLVKNFGDNSIFITGYFRHIENLINRVNTRFNDTILNRIYTNVGAANVLGLEVGATLYPSPKWRIYLGGNIYNYEIQGSLFGDEINTSNVIYSINANTNINFSPSFSMQLGFNYLSERVTAQGRDSRFYNPSLTLRKSFLNNKFALTLQWLNMDMGLLNSNEQRITTVRDSFFTTTNYVYEVDILQIGISYQFNQITKKLNLLKSEFGEKEF